MKKQFFLNLLLLTVMLCAKAQTKDHRFGISAGGRFSITKATWATASIALIPHALEGSRAVLAFI